MKKFLLFVLSLSLVVAAELPPTPYSEVANIIGKRPVMLEFGSTRCYSCQKMGKLLAKIKAKYPKAAIYFIDVFKDYDAATHYHIQLIPTQIWLDGNGKEITRHIGVLDEETLVKKLRQYKIIR